MNPLIVRTLRVPALLLAATLQLLPIVRVSVPAVPATSNIAIILFRWCAGAAAALGSAQAVSGGSTRITSPLTAHASVGIPFSMRLTTAPDPAHYWAADNVPPGIALKGDGGIWRLEGTPTLQGLYSIRLTAKDNITSGGSRTIYGTLAMTVVDPNSTNKIPTIINGVYTGAFGDTNAIDAVTWGSITVTVQPTGVYKGTYQSGPAKRPFSGRFSQTGDATNTLARPGSAPATVEMHLDLFGENVITGNVIDAASTTAFAARLKNVLPGQKAGPYTLVIPGSNDSAAAPLGDGSASLKVDSFGNAILTGALADGTRIRARAPLNLNGEIPIYVPLYSGRGALLGTLRVRPGADVDLDGNLHWLRPAGPTPKLYPDGFQLTSQVIGSAYAPPANSTWFGQESALLILIQGTLPDMRTNTVTLASGGKVTGAGPDKVTLVVAPATGLFKGVVTQPGQRPIKYQGAVLERQGFGSGAYPIGTEAGRVYFGP